MIVNHVAQGWEIIYQQAHGLLAAELAFHWQERHRPLYWTATLAAIAQHDDGQEDWRGHDGLTAAGAPADFTQVPFSLEQAQSVMHQARFQGRWRSLLTSMHLSFLYGSSRASDQNIDALLTEQEALQKIWRRGLKVTKEQAGKAYKLMQWCDRLSLILCRGELPSKERWLEISEGPDGNTYQVRQRAEGAVEVQPWPFTEPKFAVSVEISLLHQLQFGEDADLAAALREAPIEVRKWQLQQAPKTQVG